MKAMSISGIPVKVLKNGAVKIYPRQDISDNEILVIAKYLYDEGFLTEDEEISVTVVSENG